MPRALEVQAAQKLGNGYSFGNDFYQVWLTAHEWLLHGSDPYSPEMTREIQIGLYGRPLEPGRPGDPIDTRRFPYPLFADLLFCPSAEVAFPVVRVAVLCLLVVLTVATALLWLRVIGWNLEWNWTAVVVLLTLTSYPALEGLYACQLGLLVAFLLAASIRLIQHDRLLPAGVLLALTTIKPQVTALVIAYLLLWAVYDWRARRRFVVGLISAIALLVGASLWVQPRWIQSWLATVQAYHHYTAAPLVTQVLTSPLGPRFSGTASTALTIASVIGALVLAWRNRSAPADSGRFLLTLGVILAITTIVILPGQAIYDHVVLLPGILLLCSGWYKLRDSGRIPRMFFGLGTIILLWPWAAATALLVLQPLFGRGALNSSQILSAPLRTSASLPFVVLVLLVWMWRLNAGRIEESV